MKELCPLCAVALACGSGALETPETLARSVFVAVRDRDEAAFLSFQLQMRDLEIQCPALDAASRADAEAELRTLREEARRSFAACLALVSFTGARFVRADSSPEMLQNFRWPSCQAAQSVEFVRVTFDTAGTPGTMHVTKVARIGGRWVFQDGVRLCEGRRP